MKLPDKKPQIKTSRVALTLTATLALAFLALSAIVLLISSGLQLFSNFQSQQEAISNKQQVIAQGATRAVGDFIREKFGVLETAVKLANPVTAPPETQGKIVESLLGLQGAFRQLALLNTQGQVLALASRFSQTTSQQLAGQLDATALAQVRKGQRYISPVYIDSLTSEPMVVIAVPATNAVGDFQGTMAAEVNLKFMWDLVDQLKVGETGQAYVVDRQGRLIAFSETARVLRGENVAQLKAVAEFIQKPASARASRATMYQGIMGASVMGTYVPLETPDWAVVTELPWQEAYQTVIREALWSAGITLAMVVLAGLIGVYLARRLAVPLINLTETATRITGGEMALQAVVGGPLEVSSLAMAFNSMTAQLRQIMDSLEQRVADRTVDLQRALDEVEARAHEQARLLAENQQQRETIREMSVPVLPVANTTLVMPLVGALDTERLRLLQDQALRAIERARARTLILDITGVPIVDSQVAQGILMVVQAAGLLGTEVLLVGVRPEVAQALVTLGLSLHELRAYNDLQGALNRRPMNGTRKGHAGSSR